jgi:endonuclease/exonuclease/phosphatase family metal-dependent hydrolase
LRLVSWNVHECVGADGRRDPVRVVEVLEELGGDVLALQEIHAGAAGGLEDQADYLAARTGLEPVYGPTFERRGGRYGNLLLSRQPILGIEKHDLSVPGREPRGALDVAVAGPNRFPFRILSTHLGLSARERRVQVLRILELLGRDAGGRPLVLAGDFNAWCPWSGTLRALFSHFGKSAAPATFPARFPVLALDRILTRPSDLVVERRAHRSALARTASDHLPLVAEIAVTPAGGSPQTASAGPTARC